MFNKTIAGNSFPDAYVQAVWEKGIIDPNQNKDVYRKDACGNWILRSAYGDTNSNYGWEIDHIFPKSKGGTDDLGNLQPLQWAENRHKSDTLPMYWSCRVKK